MTFAKKKHYFCKDLPLTSFRALKARLAAKACKNLFTKMATNKYLLTHESDSRWGITVNTVGMQDVAAGSTYPVGDHPEDYLFSPKKGRVLREAQIVYITKGSGWFESAHQPRTKLQAGDAVVLYPYEWHSYAPDPETGWSEAWIGFAGEEANALLRKFFPQKSHPIFQVGVFDALCAAYEQAYAVAENLLPAYQQQLIGYVCLIITTVYARSQQLPYLDNPDMTGISNAIRYMRQHISSNIRMEKVAAEAGMGYSKFRKVFKDCTGFAPAQYFLRLKMERAKDYLQATDFSCKEITYRLGFDSASHFNKMFRLYEGVTPTQFRNS